MQRRADHGSAAPNMAEHFMCEFRESFVEFGVKVEGYRMRDLDRSREFNVLHARLKGAGTALLPAHAAPLGREG